jgi:hypothetical protein
VQLTSKNDGIRSFLNESAKGSSPDEETGWTGVAL